MLRAPRCWGRCVPQPRGSTGTAVAGAGSARREKRRAAACGDIFLTFSKLPNVADNF